MLKTNDENLFPPVQNERPSTITPSNTKSEVARLGWSVRDWHTAVGISHSSTYELLAEGKIDSVRFKGKRLILTHPKTFLESLRGGANA